MKNELITKTCEQAFGPDDGSGERSPKIPKEGPVPAVLSDGSQDSYGDILEAEGWDLKRFKRNPVMLWAHDRFAELPIGTVENVRSEDGKLKGDLVFSGLTAKSLEVERNVRAGILKAVSVGFAPIGGSKNIEPVDPEQPYGGLRFKKMELREVSVVPIGANVNALIGSKAEREEFVRALRGDVAETAVALAASAPAAAPEAPKDIDLRAFAAEVVRQVGEQIT